MTSVNVRNGEERTCYNAPRSISHVQEPPSTAPFNEMGLWGACRRANLRCRRKSNWRDVCLDWTRRLTDSMLWPVCGKQGRIQVFADAKQCYRAVDIPNEGNEEWTVGDEMGGRSRGCGRRLPHIRHARVVWCPGSTIIRSTRPTHPTSLSLHVAGRFRNVSFHVRAKYTTGDA